MSSTYVQGKVMHALFVPRPFLLALVLGMAIVPACNDEESHSSKSAKQKSAASKKAGGKKASVKKASGTPPTEADFELAAARSITQDNYTQALAELESDIQQEQALVRGAREQAKLKAQSQNTVAPSPSAKAAMPTAAATGHSPTVPATSKSALKPAPSATP